MQHAGSTLKKILVQTIQRHPGQESAAVLGWPLACGSLVAEKTRALRCAEGILEVEVPDAVWRKQLQGFRSRYLAELNQLCSGGVQDISFVVRNSRQP
jgi:hypothetical protein